MDICHLDSDCFYVSAERVRYPYLHHQPVGVLSNQGACVIAKSYELKAKGVTTGMPIWDALPLCRHAIYVKRDFEWYEAISRRMLSVLQTVSPTVEYYSIDEMFFDAGQIDERELQQRILREVGIPVTIGISKTRSLAKLASDTAKPFGCTGSPARNKLRPCWRIDPSRKSPVLPRGARRNWRRMASGRARLRPRRSTVDPALLNQARRRFMV